MINEYMKPETQYDKDIIKKFKHWTLYIHENQCYLGRTYLWANREDALDFFDMTKEEQSEYFQIGRSLKKAINKLFQPDLWNYATLANVMPHLHTHIIPRYTNPRTFAGMQFKDERWGMNYAPFNKEFKTPEEVLIKIRDAIKEEIRNCNK
jgi:diadenosine tetraphosphate (Ap4A) HIT family hydrolase